MPKEYAGEDDRTLGRTRYVVPLGPQNVFGPPVAPKNNGAVRHPRSFSDIQKADGRGQTILVIRSDERHAVPWTKPEDLVIDPKNPLAGVEDENGEFHAAFCDGRARAIARTIKPDVLNALFTWNGGEEIGPSDY